MKCSEKRDNLFQIITICIAIHLFCVAFSESIGAPSNSIETMIRQIQEIDGTLSTFENELSDLNAKLEQISLDSSRLVMENQTALSDVDQKISGINQLITAKKAEIVQAKAEQAQARADSIQAVKKYQADRAALQSKIKQLKTLIASTSAEVTLLRQKRDKQNQFSLQETDPKSAPLITQKRTLDSIIVIKQESLNNSIARKAQLTNDSSTQAALLLETQQIDNQNIQLIEGELQAAENNLQVSKTSLDQIRADHAQKKAAVNDDANKLLSRKVILASSVTKIMTKIKQMEKEKSKLELKTGAMKKKYDEGRKSLTDQLTNVNAVLQTREKQKEIWLLMREMYVIDSTISVVRNQLDEQIQQAAGGKRSAKKLVTEKEEELNKLMGQKNYYMSNGGVKQMDAQLKGLTLAQRHTRIEQVITNIVNDITKQTTLKMQAEQALANFDAANPIGNDPSIRRYQQLDSLITLEQQKSDMLKVQIDSLDAAIGNFKQSIAAIDAAAKNEIVLYENEMNSAAAQKNTISVKLDNAKKELGKKQSNNSAALKKITADILLVNNKISGLEKEIAANQKKAADVQNLILAAIQQFEQAKAAALEEVRQLDNQIAGKESSLAELSNQSLQYSQELNLLETSFQQTVVSSKSLINSANQNLDVKNRELQQLSSQNSIHISQSETLKKQLQNGLLSLRKSAADFTKRISSVKTKVRTAQSKRSMLVKNVQMKITALNNSINQTKKVIDVTNTSYNSAVQDSIKFESVRDAAFLQAKSNVGRQDSLLSAIQMQIQSASTELEQARNDSSNTAAMGTSAMYPRIQKIHSVDSIIQIKERELAQLKSERSQALKDSAAEAAIVQQNILKAKNLVSQKANAIATLELKYAQQIKEKKNVENQEAAKGAEFKKNRQIHASKLNGYLKEIATKEQELAQLQNELNIVETAFLTIQGNNSITATSNPVSKSTVNSNSAAQAMIEKIYTLIGENRMKEAQILFALNKSQLRKYSPEEAIQMLEASF